MGVTLIKNLRIIWKRCHVRSEFIFLEWLGLWIFVLGFCCCCELAFNFDILLSGGEKFHCGACRESRRLLAIWGLLFIFVLDRLSIFMLGVASRQVLNVVRWAVEKTWLFSRWPFVVDSLADRYFFERGSLGEKMEKLGSGFGFGNLFAEHCWQAMNNLSGTKRVNFDEWKIKCHSTIYSSFNSF